jgi:16S rRNA (guanine966-N2)-methyltransferase
MRVIAGRFKRRLLKAPKGMDTRPTSDRLRESLFSILGWERIQGARVLDLFAGTGALGIEALSRGALYAVFIEKNSQTLKVLHENIQSLGLRQESRILRWDIQKDLRCLKGEAPFDLIFMDPPYGRGLTPLALDHLKKTGLLHETSLMVCEHTEEDALPEPDTGFTLLDLRIYGKTRLAFFEPGQEKAPATQRNIDFLDNMI